MSTDDLKDSRGALATEITRRENELVAQVLAPLRGVCVCAR